MSSNNKKPSGGKDDKKNPSSKEDSPSGGKDDGGSASTGSNGGANAGEPSQPGSKPSSAGATAREGAQRLLGLAARGEWAPVDQLLKTLEKTVQSAGEDGFIVPLAGVLDTVSFLHIISKISKKLIRELRITQRIKDYRIKYFLTNEKLNFFCIIFESNKTKKVNSKFSDLKTGSKIILQYNN